LEEGVKGLRLLLKRSSLEPINESIITVVDEAERRGERLRQMRGGSRLLCRRLPAYKVL